METVPCNLCGSTDLAFVYRMPDPRYEADEWFDVVECRACGLGFVNPRPRLDEISRYYQHDYYEDLESEVHLTRFELESRYLLDRAPRPGSEAPRLLDVGCGPGGFARFMAGKGWQVEGVEPFSSIPVDDFPVHRGPFYDFEGAAGRYDAVTAWAVLEHVHDPMAYFRKAGEVLKPGGNFVFLVTNFESLSSKRLFSEDVPRHLVFFTKATVERYLAAAGLDLVRADHDDGIFKLGTRGAFQYLVTHHLRRQPYRWEDRPEPFRGYCERRGLDENLASLLRFAVADPVAFLDRVIEPLVARWQLLTNRYGVVTYVARKP